MHQDFWRADNDPIQVLCYILAGYGPMGIVYYGTEFTLNIHTVMAE